MSRMIRRFLTSTAFVLAVGLTVATAAHAGPATDVVKDKQTALFGLVGQPSSPAVDAKVTELFDKMLSYEYLAKASMADNWGKLSEPQQKEITALLRKLVQRAYEQNLRKTLNFNIQYLGESANPDGSVWVKTKAVHKTDAREEPIHINFRMTKKGESLFVGDIETEEVSLVDSYRRQFKATLNKGGVESLLEKLRKKVANP